MARKTNLLAMALEQPREKSAPPKETKRDELIHALMAKNAFKSEPIYTFGHGVAKVANQALLSYLVGKDRRDEQERLTTVNDELFGSAADAVSSDGDGPKLARALRGEPLVDSTYAERTIGVESGGDPTARNPRSSATGAGQFIDSTWLDMVTNHRPDLAEGRSREDILALRTDPDLSREMTDAYGNQNAEFLQSRGLPVDDGTKYLAHFAGPGGAEAILTADPSAPAGAVLGQRVVEANPFIADMTAGDVIDWAGRKMGGGGSDTLAGGIQVGNTPSDILQDRRGNFEGDSGRARAHNGHPALIGNAGGDRGSATASLLAIMGGTPAAPAWWSQSVV